jgi:glycosyltransferase involved in cell wall biosynthesis
MKIAFLTSLDPQNKRSWSGTLYYMARALQKHCGELSYIGPLYAPKEMLIGKIVHRCSLLLFKKGFMYYHGALVAKRYAKIAARWLAGQRFDVIVAPTGAPEIAFLKTDIPIILVEDATFGLLYNYYPVFSNLLNASFRELDTIEKRATRKAKALIYSSSWAARSAIEDYYADPAKVHVVPMGANLDEMPNKELVLTRKKSERCHLLFVGTNWYRKGGDIAFETLLELEKMGIMAELIICGCIPPRQFFHRRMKIVPFLDKNDPEQYNRLIHLYLKADFLLVPTRNECYGIVFCEASAYGLPVITTQTGGIPEVVRDGENGFVLPLAARGDEYARVIASVYQDDERYARLVYTSRAAYDERLNWNAWAGAVNTIILEMLARENAYTPINSANNTSCKYWC